MRVGWPFEPVVHLIPYFHIQPPLLCNFSAFHTRFRRIFFLFFWTEKSQCNYILFHLKKRKKNPPIIKSNLLYCFVELAGVQAQNEKKKKIKTT